MEFVRRMMAKGEGSEGGGGLGANEKESESGKLRISKEAYTYLQSLQEETDRVRSWLLGEGRALTKPVLDAQLKQDKKDFQLAKNSLWQSFRENFIAKPAKNVSTARDKISGGELSKIHVLLAGNLQPLTVEKGNKTRRSPTDSFPITELKFQICDNLEQFWLADVSSEEQLDDTYLDPKKNIFRLPLWIEKATSASHAIAKTINEVRIKT